MFILPLFVLVLTPLVCVNQQSDLRAFLVGNLIYFILFCVSQISKSRRVALLESKYFIIKIIINNVNKFHGVRNNSNNDRIHLIYDYISQINTREEFINDLIFGGVGGLITTCIALGIAFKIVSKKFVKKPKDNFEL